MEFTKYVWDLYVNSVDGRRLVNDFRNLGSDIENLSASRLERLINNRPMVYEDIATEIVEDWLGFARSVVIPWVGSIPSDDKTDLDALFVRMMTSGCMVVLEDASEAQRYGDSLSSDDVSDIHGLSLGLSRLYAEHFTPYLFIGEFYVLSSIFCAFDIPLPPVPKKRDVRGRLLYYLNVCESLRRFGDRYAMTPEQRWAFLYGFAPHFVDTYHNASLPEPTRAFFVGGGINNNGDFEYLDGATDNTVFRWQGNDQTMPGDIIVMYCLAPRSQVHSIWRAVSPGFNDPFFSFYNSVFIGRPHMIPRTSYSELRNDEVLSDHPLIRSNMQGINGRQLESKYFRRLRHLLIEKGANPETLPDLIDVGIGGDQDIANERDVEIYLLEPLLERLGFTSSDWRRQVPIRMGRGYRVYPDYLVLPKETHNDIRASLVVEAKYRVLSDDAFRNDIRQATSYALRVQADSAMLVAVDGVWLVVADQSFRADKAKYWKWSELGTADGAAHLKLRVSDARASAGSKPARADD